jgi:competence protein ComFC
MWKATKEYLFPQYECVCCKCDINVSNNKYICDKCVAGLPFLQDDNDLVLAPFEYAGDIKKMILALKYKNNVNVARALAPFMDAVLVINKIRDYVLVPVPLHKSRLRERGYNQAELLCKSLGEYENALTRTKKTKIHKNITAKEHAADLAGAFAVCADVKNKNIILIDDVYTTGITANECRKVLLNAGAKSVRILTVAKVPK